MKTTGIKSVITIILFSIFSIGVSGGAAASKALSPEEYPYPGEPWKVYDNEYSYSWDNNTAIYKAPYSENNSKWIYVKNCTASYHGNFSCVIKGPAYVVGGTYESYGSDSPVITDDAYVSGGSYTSYGDSSVFNGFNAIYFYGENAVFTSLASYAFDLKSWPIEQGDTPPNKITELVDCRIEAAAGEETKYPCAVYIHGYYAPRVYGIAYGGLFRMTGGEIICHTGPVFRCAGIRETHISLTNVDVTCSDDNILLYCGGGLKQSDIALTCSGQTLSGDIQLEGNSNLELQLMRDDNGVPSAYTGIITGEANKSVFIDKGCLWTLTDDCYISRLECQGTIDTNGFTLYVDGVPYAKAEALALNKTKITLEIQEQTALGPVFTPENTFDKTVTWMSYDPSVAAVDKNGIVTAVAPGTTTIRAKSVDGGFTARCKVKVIPVQTHVTGLTLDKASALLEEGDSLALAAEVKPDDATDKTVTWVSYDPSVAAVDKNGIVTAVAPGTTTIRAKTRDGEFRAKCKVKVITRQTHVTGLTLDKASAILNAGDYLNLAAEVKPDDATDKTVTWVSYDPSVAAVDESGKVTAVAPGTTTIRAKSRDGGFTAKCKVKVK